MGTDVEQARIEQWITDIWQDKLGIDDVEVDDNFFDLGGNSLLSLEVIELIEAEFGVRLTDRDFMFQTLGQLASICETRAKESAAKAPSGIAQRFMKTIRRT